MARFARLVSWTAVALAAPATVAFSPVHPADAILDQVDGLVV